MDTNPEKTPLHGEHLRLSARMVPFAGWEMPIQYSGVIAEHMAVRTAAGIFDVSHMGEIFICGPKALQVVQRTTTNDASKLKPGQIQYSALSNPRGGFVDDVLVHCLAEDQYFLCVNASNTAKDFEWLCRQSGGEAEVEDASRRYAQMAIQGPQALSILQTIAEVDLSAIRNYWFVQTRLLGAETIVSRTGYTGEDGFEIYCPPDSAAGIWGRLMEAGKPKGLMPAGLAARNTLRLEAKMTLYGNDIDDTTTVLEADLGWIVKLEKPDFIGREVLCRQKEEGVKRLLVGFEVPGRVAAREHYPVRKDGKEIGTVASGSYAPYLKKNIGLAYLPVEIAGPGTSFEVVVRDQVHAAQVVPTPFYKRPRHISPAAAPSPSRSHGEKHIE